jgi:Lrp/AsnC family leucine-responsive transcriptional regulator
MNKSIDDADIKLIQVLSMDGRVSISRLAEETGLSYTSIRNRILRLIHRGLLAIKPFIHPKLVGNVAAIVRFKTSKPEKLANHLSKCNKILGLMINHDGLIAMVYSRSKTEIAAFISRIKELDDHLEEYSIEYGRIPSSIMLPIRNPFPDCTNCIFYRLGICSGCLPILRIKNNRKSRISSSFSNKNENK